MLLNDQRFRYDLIIKDYEHAIVILGRIDSYTEEEAKGSRKDSSATGGGLQQRNHAVFESLRSQLREQIRRVKEQITKQLMDMPKSLEFQVVL